MNKLKSNPAVHKSMPPRKSKSDGDHLLHDNNDPDMHLQRPSPLQRCTCGHDHSHESHENHIPHTQEHNLEKSDGGHDHPHHNRACTQDSCTRSHTHFEYRHNQTTGHPTDCTCQICNPHIEYCDVCGEVLAGCTCRAPGEHVTKTYSIENLDCANCAAKIESQINRLPQVTSAVITFATKQLRITAKSPDDLIPEVQRLATSIEPDVRIFEKDHSPKGKDVLSKEVTDLPKRRLFKKENRSLVEIILGFVLLTAGKLLESQSVPSALVFVIYAASYLLLGWKVVWTALKNLTNGHVFDENFLMSIATIGAFVISDYAEAVGVMLFYRIGEYFEDRAVEKSRKQIMDAVDMRPEVVNLAIGDEVKTIAAAQARAGDILVVRPGDRIPLDGVIIEGESRIDTSPVTGESVPVKAGYGDEVTSGCVNTSGLLKIRVEKVLEDSMVTRILDSVENAAASKPKIDRFITRFARIYTPVVVILALCTAVIPSLITGDWSHWVYTALTFLVISCPCALVLSVPLAFFSGIGAGSKQGILFKGGVSLEALKDVSAVVMDKTGTITEGNFKVQQTVPSGSYTQNELLLLAAKCELDSTHPIGTSIVTAAKDRGIALTRPESVEEIAGQGIRAVIDGRIVLCGNQKLMEAYHIPLSDFQRKNFGTEVLLAVDQKYAGHIVISDTVKKDAASAIDKLKSFKITTAMLTGDALDSAKAVAKETGIDEVHARLLPEEKLSELQRIRSTHGRIMFVGDGINDAPVLAGADVGAAMGSGADAAIEAADVVFMNSSVTAIPQAIAIARFTGVISRQNIAFALTVKVLVMILGLMGFASMWMAVFADSGVAILCVLNSIRILYSKRV